MTSLRQTLPLTYLLFTRRGRLGRLEYLHALLLLGSAFYLLHTLIHSLGGQELSWLLSPVFLWGLVTASSKRLHDVGWRGRWLAMVLIPVAGPIWLAWQLLARRGERGGNRYGPSRKAEIDYHKNDAGYQEPAGQGWVINDVTKLNPIVVGRVERPGTVEELREILRSSNGPISVGGGRFSMGGQTASEGSLHIDMRGMNQVLEFSKDERWIRVQAGIRWCDIQRFIDGHNLSVKIMQSYANFTVGGALSVNAHGRYVGLGPVVLSVRWISLLLVDGSLVRASGSENQELFYAAIGGYGAIGIIVEAELDLEANEPLECVSVKMLRQNYADYFNHAIRGDSKAVFHNGDMYPPRFGTVRAVTWRRTLKKATVKTRLMPLRDAYPISRYFIWAFCETPFGHWRREHLFEPLLYLRRRVHWRNYEAGYDVAELEPRSRAQQTYVLQEYFVPVAQFDGFTAVMAEVFIRHRVKLLNISIRHAVADPGTLLAWAREEVFAFVIYHKQGTDAAARNAVAVWTRELIEAALNYAGTYYLPYQAHATEEQFHQAYPKARELFGLKARLDPDYRLRHILWTQHYQPNSTQAMSQSSSEFHAVFDNAPQRDGFFRFLQVVFHLYPEAKFHHLIHEVTAKHTEDAAIYREVQQRLKEIKPFLSELTFALPALKKQKREMTRQTLELLGEGKRINGYLEIGSTGRYISDLRHHIKLEGPIYLLNDVAPSNGPGDIFERGQLAKLGQFIPLNDYAAIEPGVIPDGSVDLITIFIGFHHCPTGQLDGFIQSLHRILRPGGSLIVRDHDVRTPAMATFVSLVHTVFNLGLGVPWETDSREFKQFRSVDEWLEVLSKHGFQAAGARLFQDKDPSDNALFRLIKA